MKIAKTDIEIIQKLFKEMQTKEDFAYLLSIAKNMMYGKECTPYKVSSINYYANPNFCKHRYSSFTIKKKSGGDRTIHAPVKGLKSILKSLNFVLHCLAEPHKAATGFVPNRSIVFNAKQHINKNYVYNIDLKDFFHSFHRSWVKYGFMLSPFKLDGEREPLAFLIASLCTHPFELNGTMQIVLPQGSPTSPTITNILCYKLDRRLNGLAKRFNVTYTRYADDITFSSHHSVFGDKEFQKELRRIIEDQNLEINEAKERLQKPNIRQEVTGLTVNEKVNVRRKYVKQLRMWLYYWEKYGFEKAESIFLKDYLKERGHLLKGHPNIENVIDGKLQFLKMVKGDDDSTYIKLRTRFDLLLTKESPLTSILEEWEDNGIESAMNLFYKENE